MSSGNAIFLSYSSDDAEVARRICEALRTAGLEVWFDQSELRGGDAWDQSIRKQIKDCALFVPLISARTESRLEGYFRLEWRLADQRTHLMAKGKPFLLPAVIDDTRDADAHVPDSFLEVQWSRVTTDAAIAAFAERVAKLVEGRGVSGDTAPKGAPVLESGTAPGRAIAGEEGRFESDAPNAGVIGKPPATATPSLSATSGVTRPDRRKQGAFVAIGLVAVVALIAGGVAYQRDRKAAFIAESLKRVEELNGKQQFFDAFLVARDIEPAGGANTLTGTPPDDYSRVVKVSSTPAGAKIELRAYQASKDDGAWIDVGTAPQDKLRAPRGVMEWRATLPDGSVHRLVTSTAANKVVAFAPLRASADGGDVEVPAGTLSIGGLIGLQMPQDVKLDAFAMDRLEVRNRDFARFVAAGGYTREEFWTAPFAEGARTLGFAEAMARFKDTTGRPGPAHWKLGSFPEGEAELPVRGVSWFEAAAYARFAGKELPTLYHWYRADTGGDTFLLGATLMPSANFSGKGPRAAAQSRTIGAYGAVDMAGNVREWVANRTDKGNQLVVGGSWLEVEYQYKHASRLSAWERPADVGFRCMKRSGMAVNEIASAAVRERPVRENVALKPVSEAEYAIYSRLYERSRVPLALKVEAGERASPYWTRTRVRLATGYGNERMDAYLYLPKDVKPPYQTVIFMHGSGVHNIHKSYEQMGETPEGAWFAPEMIVRGGRALLVPIWKGSYERHSDAEITRGFLRERLPQWVAEFQRSVDFLHSRDDIDKSRIGFFGYSLGAMWAPNLLALEPRVTVAVLLAGGLEGALNDGDFVPTEVEPAIFAPHVKAAVLMLNGRNDIRFPYETSQVPLFKLLGSPTGKKLHKTYPGGHSTLGWFNDITRDTHDWFDQQFGPVAPLAGK